MSYTILLADDSATTHRVMELTFAGQDIRVVSVPDGEQAVERMRSTRPDILLAEVALARVDGYKLSEHVRSTPALSGVPVLLLTGAFDVVDEARVRASGAAGIIVKPFEPEFVIKRVKELLGISAKDQPMPGGRLVTSAERPAHEPEAGPGPRAAASLASAAKPAPAAAAVADVTAAKATAAVRSDERSRTSAAPPASGRVESSSSGSDDYLDQLDAAFNSLDQQLSGSVTPPPEPDHVAPAAASPSTPPSAPEPPVFEIDEEWFGGNLASAARAAKPTTTPAVPGVADTFQALLAAEHEETPPRATPDPVFISDDVIERIATRVAQRLSEGVFVDTVRHVVKDVAERLVREEIARIRAKVDAQKR